MKKSTVVAALSVLLCLMAPAPGRAQLQSATISGTVSDATGALIPGVEVRATNDGTGIVTNALTNSTGNYSFNLSPGTYTVSASLASFQTQRYTEVLLGTTQRLRLNFTLQVAGAATEVEVVAAADTLLAETSQSVGDVLPENMVQNLPSVGNDIVTILNTISGVRLLDDGVRGTVNGIISDHVQIRRDGVEASGGARTSAGFRPATYTNPDMISEVRVIVAPVDAELGRGNGQFLMTTRSGTNQLRGTAMWGIRNSALDANTWGNNNDTDPLTGAWSPTDPDWVNRNQYSISMGGPIVENKTFFFALWDHSIVKQRENVNLEVLTPCARNGVFRFFPGWNNGNILDGTSGSPGSSNNQTQVVDSTGRPALFIDGAEDTSAQLQYASVFGQLSGPPVAADCSDARPGVPGSLLIPGTEWDQYRTDFDPTGFMDRYLDPNEGMPLPNNYEEGDGLNTAGFRWVRALDGGQSIFGRNRSDNVPHKQINFKVDHNFTESHKLAVTYTYEKSTTNRSGAEREWPNGYSGIQYSRPQHLAMNFTSTLSPTLLNEVTVGFRKSGFDSYNAFNNPETGEEARSFYPEINGYTVAVRPGDGAMSFMRNQGWIDGTTSSYRDRTGLWSFGDTLSWVQGEHSFKFGGSVRRGYSHGYDAGINPTSYPQALGGTTPLGSQPAITSADVPGLNGSSSAGNRDRMQHMLTALAGSLNVVSQYYWMQDPTRTDAFEDVTTFGWRERVMRINEFAGFVKDDWKVTQDLTLNLGFRYDWIGVVYDDFGMMPAPAGRNEYAWGMSWDGTGNPFEQWMVPGERGQDTEVAFVGKNSPTPDRPWRPSDNNNFAPAVGFAYQLPWIDRATTLRGGYQISYLQSDDNYNALFQETNWPGMTYQATHQGDSLNPYLSLADAANVVPAPVLVPPLGDIPRYRQSSIYVPDPEQTSPYIQNITMTLTHSLARNMTVEVGYVATLARKLRSFNINLNEPNFLTNGLKEAFDAVRYGNDLAPEAQVLEDLFEGINIVGNDNYGPVGTVYNGVYQSAGLHLRNHSDFDDLLANGDYRAAASELDQLAYIIDFGDGINTTLPVIPAGQETGAVLRYANQFTHPGEFPDNFIVANPQFNALNYNTNPGSENFHSGHVRFTLRPTAGVSTQMTYTWSRSTGYPSDDSGPQNTNDFDRKLDYQLMQSTRLHEFRSHGLWSLPMGPNQMFWGNSSGTLARIVEGWQFGWIYSLYSGGPQMIENGVNHLYNSGVPNVVGTPEQINALLKDGNGKVEFGNLSNTQDGTYWGVPGEFSWDSNGNMVIEDAGDFLRGPDPQCLDIHPDLQNGCDLTAIADSNGNMLLRSTYPGTRGSFGINQVFGFGSWRLDASLSKEIQIDESRSLQFRMDAENVLNHPQPNGIETDITDADFGTINGKNNDYRNFQAEIRFNF